MNRILIAFLAGSLVGVPFTCWAFEAGEKSDLDAIVGELKVSRPSTLHLAEGISRLGFRSAVISKSPSPVLILKVSSRSVAEILDVVVSSLPGYRWELSSGTVFLLPPKEVADLAFQVLNSTIPAFSSYKYNAFLTFSALAGHCANYGLPVSDEHAKFAANRPEFRGLLAREIVSVDVPEGTRLIDALESIARADRGAYWTFSIRVGLPALVRISGGSTTSFSGPTVEDVRQGEAIRSGKESPYATEVYSSDELENESPK